MKRKNKIIIFFLLLFLSAGIVLRFYNLNWGSPFYFHPDERNIASSISQLDLLKNLNPHFFAYGSFPIYTIYLTGIVYNWHVSFENAILISRFYSASFSLLLLPLLYFIVKMIDNKQSALLAVLFSLFSVGFIQYAHFGTFEMWLTFFSTLLFYFSLRYLKNPTNTFLFFISVTIGLLMAIKVSSLIFYFVPLLLFSLQLKKRHLLKTLLLFLKNSLFLLIISSLIFIVTSPYVFLDFSSFINSVHYESSVALGTLPVFYTGSFFNTIPVLYHFISVYPFLLNPLLTILFIPSFFFILFISIKQKNMSYFLLCFFFLLVFVSQAFFFVKWIRYTVPSLPFIYCIIAIAILSIFKKIKLSKNILLFVIVILISISALFSLSYFITVYTRPDSRISAAWWAKYHIPENASILSEVYDLGITPFNPYFQNIDLYNFYDMDVDQTKKSEIFLIVKDYEYIILPSQRLLKSRLQHPEKFPSAFKFYDKLTKEKIGFKIIYQTPCDIFCKITYFGNPVWSLEETATVFDRPTIFLYRHY